MKLWLTSTVTVALLAAELALTGTAAGAQAGAGEPAAPSGAVVSVIVTGDAPLDATTVAAATGGAGRVVGTIDAIGTTVVEVPAAQAAAATRRLDAVPGVDHAQRDQQVQAFLTPNDPNWPAQSSLREVDAPAAWDRSTGSSTVILGVVDSGVTEVPELAGRVLPGYDFVNGDTDPSDDYAHGTATALVAAAAGNDGSGFAGLCWSCRILPVKVLDGDGFGAMSDVAAGIVYAVDHGADVINLSLGGAFSEPAVTSALAYAFANDVVVVASAGNDGKTERSYPAAEAGVVSVAGTSDGTRRLFPASRRGPSWVDIAAPWCNWVSLGSGSDDFCGTSSAAPVVSGTVALLRAMRPTADRNMVANALLTTADFTPTAGQVAYGFLDAGRATGAINSVTPGPVPPPPDITPPTVSISVPGGYQSGIARVWATAEDDQTVAVDELWVDGYQVASVPSPPTVAALDFDTRTFGDGPHTVVALVADAAGHQAMSNVGTIVVDNANPLGLLTSPGNGTKATGSFVARAYVTDPNGIMGTFFVANGKVVGGFTGAGWGEVTVPITRSGPIRVVALTVDAAGHISGTNQSVITGSVARRRARR